MGLEEYIQEKTEAEVYEFAEAVSFDQTVMEGALKKVQEFKLGYKPRTEGELALAATVKYADKRLRGLLSAKMIENIEIKADRKFQRRFVA